jgi:hypothetical protein
MRVLFALIVFAIGMSSVDAIAARSGQTSPTASVSGTASDVTGRALSNTVVQLRSVSTGQLAGSATTNGLGQFSIAGLPPGTYVVEVINAAGQIVGTSGSVAVSAGAAVTGVGVTTTAAAAIVAAHHGLSTHAIVLIVGAASAASVAGGIAAATGGTASGSQ